MAKKKKTKNTRAQYTRNGGTMTEAMYFSKIRSALRKAFRYWVPALEALKKASRPSQSENKRLKKEYQCNHCKKWFPNSEVNIDHIIPCGSLNSYDDIKNFIIALTPENVDAFQVLCESCHNKKTQNEREQRKKRK